MSLRICSLLLLGLSLPLMADSPAVPQAILPEQQQWFSPPPIPGLSAAWMLGAEQGDGAYALRVKLAAGTKIPPHTHPDSRSSVVLSGTLYVGFGEVFDQASMVAIPAGALYEAPAGVVHYLWARDGEVVYQENGYGPTATRLPDSAD